MVDDVYISRLKKIEKKASKPMLLELKEGYGTGIKARKGTLKEHISGTEDHVRYIPKENIEAEKILKSKEYSPESNLREKGYAMAIANKLMRSDRSMESNLLGAEVYEKIGQGRRDLVKKKLLRKFEVLSKKRPDLIPEYGKKVRKFLEGNPSKKGGLEKLLGFVGIIAVLIGIYYLFFNLNITGNVVANLGSISQNFFVNFILVCILGLMGYFYLK